MTTVMIIDDDPAIRTLLKQVLSREGFEVVTADNGRSALKKLERNPVELVITDIFMPELDGIEFICTMNDIQSNIKIIAISGGSGFITPELYLSIANNVGAVTVLDKPIQPHKLIQTVNDLLDAELVVER